MDKQCSRAELDQVMHIIEAGTFLEEWDYALTKDGNMILEDENEPAMSDDLAQLIAHDRLMNAVSSDHKTVLLKKHRINWKLPSAAAAAVLVLFTGWWLFNTPVTSQSDIPPGTSGATLVLGNGKRITLNGSKSGMVVTSTNLRYNDGTEVEGPSTSSDSELYSAITAAGNMYMLTLPDGTQVWLNAASQLDFPSRFEDSSRVVSLTGEAFFKVAKDKQHPFIVKTKGQQVKVLGTQFNINSYSDEQATTTTLTEGSVEITSGKNKKILKPGQQGILESGGSIAITEIDTALAMAWKNNKFIFENNNIQSVMRMVQRWYNVEVIYTGPLPDAAFGGKVSRFSNVGSVLRMLETTGGAHFRIEGRKIYVSK